MEIVQATQATPLKAAPNRISACVACRLFSFNRVSVPSLFGEEKIKSAAKRCDFKQSLNGFFVHCKEVIITYLS